MWYIYTMGDDSAIRKNETAVCKHMDGPTDYHTKPEKDVTYM